MNRILIIGATSAIAQATAREWAKKGAAFYLLARNQEELIRIADELHALGSSEVQISHFEVSKWAGKTVDLDNILSVFSPIDIVLIAYGTLIDQELCEFDTTATLEQLNTNAVSVILLLTELANYFELQRYGTIAVIGSVAGDLGKASNYVYGSAKAAVQVFTEGLRQRLHRSNVNVLLIKPGLVDTPMTEKFQKNRLWASSGQVAADIVRAVNKQKDVVYTPGYWRFIIGGLRLIPTRLFKRVQL